MYTPHIVTVYNLSTETDKTTLEDVTTIHATVLHGVFLEACKAVNVKDSGLTGADAVTLYIPFSVEAVDAETGDLKHYAPPLEFWKASDRSGLWTLSVDGNGGETRFAKGEFTPEDVTALDYRDDCWKVTKVDTMDYGGEDMQHWEVGGV